MNIFSKNVILKPNEKKVINNTYKYNIETFLENVYTNNERNKVYLCFYFVDNNMPILYYLLHKSVHMNFFNFKYKDICDLSDSCSKFIEEQFTSRVNKKGYKEFNNNIYIFFECLNKENIQNGVWCVLDEICNKQRYLNNVISQEVTSFFLHNKDFIYLKNKDNIKIETPIVCYQYFDDELELMYYSYNTNKKEYYDYENCKQKYIARYILFISCENIIFNKPYQYKINYTNKPESLHK